MFAREFYPLLELAARWGCSVGDLLHFGGQNQAQICVNIYGMASDLRLRRMVEEIADTEQATEPQIRDGRREAFEIGTGFDVAPDWPIHDMPDGIYSLIPDDVRLIEMPNGLPFELYEADKFYIGYWFSAEFDPPVTIELGNLVVLHEEVKRLESLRMSEKRGNDAPFSTSNNPNKSDMLAHLNQAAYLFWGNVDLSDKATYPKTKEIEQWLFDKGYSQNLAKSGASIIRPVLAGTGRTPEKL